MINQVSALLLVSEDPEKLAKFYTRAFGLKFKTEHHDDMDVHYGAFIGSVHIGIHPPANFPEGTETGKGGVKVAFDTLDFDYLVEHLRTEGIPLLYEPVKNAWSIMTALRDPDGNFIELLQPCNEILKAAATRGRSTSSKIESYIAEGGGFGYG